MQGSSPSSLSWQQIAFGIVASFIGGGGALKLFNTWINRKKIPGEIDVNQAQAVKTRAEGRKLNADADVQFSEIIERLHVRIDQMQVTHDEIRCERDDLKTRNELQRIELSMRDQDIKKLKGLLDVHGIKFSEFDEH